MIVKILHNFQFLLSSYSSATIFNLNLFIEREEESSRKFSILWPSSKIRILFLIESLIAFCIPSEITQLQGTNKISTLFMTCIEQWYQQSLRSFKCLPRISKLFGTYLLSENHRSYEVFAFLERHTNGSQDCSNFIMGLEPNMRMDNKFELSSFVNSFSVLRSCSWVLLRYIACILFVSVLFFSIN